MISLLRRLDTLLSGIPHELMAPLARLSIGTIFLRSGMLKLEGWESAPRWRCSARNTGCRSCRRNSLP